MTLVKGALANFFRAKAPPTEFSPTAISGHNRSGADFRAARVQSPVAASEFSPLDYFGSANALTFPALVALSYSEASAAFSGGETINLKLISVSVIALSAAFGAAGAADVPSADLKLDVMGIKLGTPKEQAIAAALTFV